MRHADIERLSEELATTMPQMDEQHQRLALSLYRLLAEGEPVPRERLAQRAGTSLEDVGTLLDEQPDVHLDDRGQVVGFWGMALAGTSHRMLVDRHAIRAWCAWDTLFLPELIGQTVMVESPCPETGESVRLTVGPAGVESVSPAGAVLSFLRPDGALAADTIVGFCRLVHFFVSEDAAARWTARHPKTFVLSIEDGFEIGRQVNRARFGAVLARAGRLDSASR
jgi:alkylmercury lyase